MAAGNRALLIIGNGPSARPLMEGGYERLPEDIDTFGMGAAYRWFQSAGWWPTYYALADSKVVYSHRAHLAKVVNDPAVTTRRFYLPLPVTDSPRLEVIPHSPTGDFCLREALRLGYRTIYLIGIEGDYVEEIPECRRLAAGEAERLGFDRLGLDAESRDGLRVISRTPVASPNYFFDWYQRRGDVYSLPRADIHRQVWDEDAAAATAAGARVVNLSERSAISVFERGRLEDLLRPAVEAPQPALDADPRNVGVFFPTLRTEPERAFWRNFVAEVQARGYRPVIITFLRAEATSAQRLLGAPALALPPNLFALVEHPDFQDLAPPSDRVDPRLPPAMEAHFADSEFLVELYRDRSPDARTHGRYRDAVAAYNNWLVQLFRELRLGRAVINNDTFMKAAAVREVADRLGVACVHSERSPTTSQWFEDRGYYAHSGAAGVLRARSWTRPGPHEAHGRRLIAALRQDAGGHRSLERRGANGAVTGAEAAPRLPERYFLLPLDAVTNTGWAPRGHHLKPANYPLFDDPDQAIRALAAAAGAAGATLVVKPHPSDRYLRQLALPDNAVVYTGPIEAALDGAALVFSFLTKVAFSALAFGRPVVTLAPNVAALSGLTVICRDAAGLDGAIRRALALRWGAAERTRLARFLGMLDREFFVDEQLANPGAQRLLRRSFPAQRDGAAGGDLAFREAVARLDRLAPDPAEPEPTLVHGPYARERGRRIEEVEIVRRLFEAGVVQASSQPLMVDVGACKGTAFAGFAEAGWRVHAFEPNPPMHAHIRKVLERSPYADRVTLNALAVSERSGEELPFYTSEESVGISSLSPFRDTHVATAVVKTIRLDEYCAAEGLREIDFLKVDTEGFDLFVLKSLNWRRKKPRVIVCEFEDAKTERLGYRASDVIDLLLGRGYDVYVSEWHPITRYGGGEHRWRRMLKAPTAALAPDAWGNLIAFRDGVDADAFREATVYVAELLTSQFYEGSGRRRLAEAAAVDAQPDPADEARLDEALSLGWTEQRKLVWADPDALAAAREAQAQAAREAARAAAAEARRRPLRALAFVGGFLLRHAWLPAGGVALAAWLLLAGQVAPDLAPLWRLGWAGLSAMAGALLAGAYAQHLHLRAHAQHLDLQRRHEELTAAHYYLNGTVDDLRRRMDEAEAAIGGLKATPSPLPRQETARTRVDRSLH